MKNKSYFKVALCIFVAFFSLNGSAQITRILDIPGRLQWDNANGYCGEESIQMIGLYYGNYISQDVCRTVAGGEVWVGDDNGEVALDDFSFTINEWDYNQATPQYQDYLVWAKQQLYNYHPVIITVFVQGMDDPDYDHIIPAIGFSGADINTFNATDELMFNDCYTSTYYTRTFQSIWDTRSMSGNGANYEYCIPMNVDYGCAVTGIKDVLHETKPVHIALDRWDEPNVTLGESPVILNATITTDSLTIGAKYALLRYDNYINVPSSGFAPAGADATVYFVASATSQTFSDSFMSNSAVFYRCIPYDFSNIPKEAITDDIRLKIFPNPFSSKTKIRTDKVLMNATLTLQNSLGQEIKKIKNISGNEIELTRNNLPDGIYVIHIVQDNKTVMTGKLIIAD
jgi:hypothetical protein